MAISTDRIKKKKKDYDPEPARKMPSMKPFGKKGKSIQRNPHRDSGDKKPSLKTKSSIIKDKAKKGQGLNRGGVARTKKKVTERRKELMDMLGRLYGSGKPKNKIVPKKKPKKDPPSAMQRILKNLNRKEILVRAKDNRKK
jgi:hypothetical protein